MDLGWIGGGLVSGFGVDWGWIGVDWGGLALVQVSLHHRIPRILRFDKTGKLCRAEKNIILLEGGTGK